MDLEYIAVFLLGGLLYGLLELLWRGWTHWTMLLCGGLCLLLMYLITGVCRSPVRRVILCAAAVTVIEFFTGCLVNLALGWGVWDYSELTGNVLGQICPLYSGLWLLLSVPGTLLCRGLRRVFVR